MNFVDADTSPKRLRGIPSSPALTLRASVRVFQKHGVSDEPYS
jgi:hypothetical protein